MEKIKEHNLLTSHKDITFNTNINKYLVHGLEITTTFDYELFEASTILNKITNETNQIINKSQNIQAQDSIQILQQNYNYISQRLGDNNSQENFVIQDVATGDICFQEDEQDFDDRLDNIYAIQQIKNYCIKNNIDFDKIKNNKNELWHIHFQMTHNPIQLKYTTQYNMLNDKSKKEIQHLQKEITYINDTILTLPQIEYKIEKLSLINPTQSISKILEYYKTLEVEQWYKDLLLYKYGSIEYEKLIEKIILYAMLERYMENLNMILPKTNIQNELKEELKEIGYKKGNNEIKTNLQNQPFFKLTQDRFFKIALIQGEKKQEKEENKPKGNINTLK